MSPDPNDLFADGGNAGALMRRIDWSKNPLGPVERWPQSLRILVPVMLASRFAMRILWGPEFIFLFNDSYRPILGADKYPSAMGSRASESFAEVWPTVGPLFHRVLAGESVAFEDTLFSLHRNGYLEECYFTLSYSPIRGDQGTIDGLLGVVHETTERVLAERRLLSLRELAVVSGQGRTLEQACWLSAAALQKNNADVPFALLYLCEPDGQNTRLAAHFGLDNRSDIAPPQLALGAAPWSLDAEQARVIISDLMHRCGAIQAGPYSEHIHQAIVVRLWRRGHDRPYGFLVAGINPRHALDDDYQAFFELASEHIVTSLVSSMALSDAEQARNRLYQQFMQAPMAVALVVGPSLVYELANPRYEEMVGRQGLLGKSIQQAFPELAEDAPILEMLRQVLASAVPFEAEEYGISLERSGVLETAYFKLSCQPLREIVGGNNAILIVAVDVTPQVVARQERQQLLAREREFRAQAEIANRAKDEFLAMLGHELRNPLAPILTALQLMRLRGDSSLERERAIIERQVGHVTRLVDDLLDVSRITRGNIELKREPIELADAVTKAVEIASPLIEQRRHHLRVAVPPAGLMLDADPVRLAQIISNLLTNAAKYTEPGGNIDVAATATSAWVELRVRDNGIGLSPAMLTQIFEPFVQERQASDRAQGGLGLGLAIVRAFTHMHGGTIVVHSAGLGDGTEFCLRLPHRTSVGAAERRDETRAPAVAAHPAHVLIVDDNVDAAELLGQSLMVMGYTSAIAHDGPSALALAAGADFEVAVLDIGLPVMDGYELASHLRTLPGGPAMHLIALTGYGQHSDRERSRMAGFQAHLVKPIQLAELRGLIEKLMGPRAT